MRAFNLTGELENMLLGSLNQATQSGKVALDNYPVDPNLLSQLQTNMPVMREQMKQQGVPPLLLVMPQIRPLLARYARLFAPGLRCCRTTRFRSTGTSASSVRWAEFRSLSAAAVA